MDERVEGKDIATPFDEIVEILERDEVVAIIEQLDDAATADVVADVTDVHDHVLQDVSLGLQHQGRLVSIDFPLPLVATLRPSYADKLNVDRVRDVVVGEGILSGDDWERLIGILDAISIHPDMEGITQVEPPQV